jgi:hypothetical protein
VIERSAVRVIEAGDGVPVVFLVVVADHAVWLANPKRI